VEVTIGVQARGFTARNVAALLPGADPALRDEYVVFTAHHDHLGISAPDERGDSIYNGFSDNAAGSAMLLAIAEAMARGPRPARSTLFLWFTGEERGLLGSDWFAAHPTLAPARLAAVINLDAGAPPAPCVQWRISGADYSTLGRTAIEVARRNGWDATAAPASPNSDYFPFLRIGVPAVSIVPGPGAYEGMTTETSRALFRRWDRYHQAGDHWFPDFPFAGLLRYADYAYQLGMTAAAAPRPLMLAR
jgi:Zn-dependent M28 family amino/carboxypeptidase